MVRPPEKPGRQGVVYRRLIKLGGRTLRLSQLKILKEVITLSIFVPFAILYMDQPLKLDYVWAGLCLLGAVYFIFRA